MYDIGDTVPLAFELAGDSTVVLTVELPDGTSATPEVTRAGLGRYTAGYVPTQAGLHRIRWVASGALSGSHQDVFNVRPAGDLQLISLAAAKAHLNMTETVDDEELRGWIAAATRVAERHTGLTMCRRSFTEQACGPRFHLTRTPLLSVESPTSATVLDASSGHVEVATSDPVTVVYTAGMRVVPENYLGAVAIISAHLFDTQRISSLGQQVSVTGEDTLTPGGLGFALPERAVQLLGARAPVVA